MTPPRCAQRTAHPRGSVCPPCRAPPLSCARCTNPIGTLRRRWPRSHPLHRPSPRRRSSSCPGGRVDTDLVRFRIESEERESARPRRRRSHFVRRGRVLPTRRDARFHGEATLSPGPGRRKARVFQPRDSASAGQTSGGGCSVADGLGPRYVQRVRDARTAPRTAIAPLDHAGSHPYGRPTGGARLPCAQSKGEPHDRCRGQCGGPGVSRWSR